MQNPKDVHVRIRELRELRGFSQNELAERAGYASGKAMISQIENGKIQISSPRLHALAKALNVTPNVLLGIDDGLEDLNSENALILSKLNQLNEEGRKMVLEYIDFISSNPKYTAEKDDSQSEKPKNVHHREEILTPEILVAIAEINEQEAKERTEKEKK